MQCFRSILFTFLIAGCNSCREQQGSASPSAAAATRDSAPSPLEPGEFVPGSRFGDVWCLSQEAIYSSELVKRHVPEGFEVHGKPGVDDGDVVSDDCWRAVSARAGERLVAWRVFCGDAYMGKRAWYKPSRFDEAEPDERLGKGVTSWRRWDSSEIFAWDSDTPCLVTIGIQGFDDNGLRAQALAKDLLRLLTPERISSPRAQYVVGAEDETGDRARAKLARWDQKRETVDGYAPLSEGYPKVVKSDDYPGLPPGKYYLLFGVCANNKGAELASALQAVEPLPLFVPIGGEDAWSRVYSVDGKGLTEACPPNLTGTPRSGGQGAGSWYWILGDGKIITVGYVNSLNAAVGQPYSKAGVFLFDKDGSVLDSKVIVEDVPRPETKRGRYSSRATVTYGVCEAKMWYQSPTPRVGFFCESFWGDQKCSSPGHRNVNYEFAEEDGKLVVERQVLESNGASCRPNVADD